MSHDFLETSMWHVNLQSTEQTYRIQAVHKSVLVCVGPRVRHHTYLAWIQSPNDML